MSEDTSEACRAVTLGFFRALDTREHARAASLMAPDGVWDRQGKLLEGRAAILEALEQRPAGRATAHIVTNLVVEMDGAEHARVSFYLVAYEGEVKPGEVPVARIAGMRYGTDTLVRLPEGWRIREKRSDAVMKGG